MKLPAFIRNLNKRHEQNVYVVFAMKRSGHHAVVNWICKQNGSIRHQNNPFKQWEKKRIIANKSVDYGENPSDLLINLEDFDLTDWDKYKFQKFPVIDRTDRVYKILLVREFRNWLASCIGRKAAARARDRDVYAYLQVPHKNERGDHKPPRVELYKQHLEEAVSSNFFEDIIVIKYDEWFASPRYRRKLAAVLGLQFTDEGKEDVVTFGYGSSFDKQEYDGQASKMNVLNRWRGDNSDHELFSILDEHRDIETLSEQLFDLDSTKVIADAPNRLLTARKSSDFDEFCSLVPVFERFNIMFPELEIHFDATTTAADEKDRMAEYCESRGVKVGLVERPELSGYRFYTGPLHSGAGPGRRGVNNIMDVIRIRTGLDLAAVASFPGNRQA